MTSVLLGSLALFGCSKSTLPSPARSVSAYGPQVALGGAVRRPPAGRPDDRLAFSPQVRSSACPPSQPSFPGLPAGFPALPSALPPIAAGWPSISVVLPGLPQGFPRLPGWPSPAPAPDRPSGPPSPWPQQAPSPAGEPAEWVSFEDRVLALTNQARARGAVCGGQSLPPVGPLQMNDALRRAARGHSADMGARGYFDHVTPEGRDPGARALAAGHTDDSVGENIGAGYSTPESVVEGWLASPGHCQNLLDAGYRVLGVGYARHDGSPYRHYWTQVFD